MTPDLGPEEEQVAKEFLEEVNALRRQSNISPISWKDAVKFCMARKFNKERAIELQRNHADIWIKERLLNINPFKEDVRKELISGKLTILDSRDSNGAAIALFTARFHNPLASSRNITLQSLVHQLDAALDSVDTQRNGLVFVYDMTDSRFSNFDYDLSVKILDLLKGSFPARLKKVLIVLAPLWFKAPFKILRLFVKEKLRDRVYTVNDTEILQHIPAISLPTHLGGAFIVDHLAWLRKCLTVHRLPDPEIRTFFGGADHPNYMTSKFTAHAANVAALSNVDNKHHQGRSVAPKTDDFGPRNDVNNRHSNNHGIIPGRSRGDPPSVHPPSVPDRDIDDTPEIPSLPPSWQDEDPTESEFPAGIEDLMTPGEQLQGASVLGRNGLVSEYVRIRNQPYPHSFINSRLLINGGKNRYSDVLCSDYTRVILDTSHRGEAGDYINANHVNSYKQKRGYICCQGPLPKTFEDFWRMIWQEKVRTIVMTTKLVEKGRSKCGTYWPQEVNAMETYGAINVMNMDMEVEPSGDFQTSTLCICNKATGETRFIKHMLFLKWPDYGIPPCADAFLHFVKSVREIQSKSVKEMPEWKGHPRGPPIVVHCSAGIGRTGTFICSDICMYLLDEIGKLNISSVVRQIRTQRAFAIQMPDQYVFCHIAILQYAQLQGYLPTDIDIPQLLEDDV